MQKFISVIFFFIIYHSFHLIYTKKNDNIDDILIVDDSDDVNYNNDLLNKGKNRDELGGNNYNLGFNDNVYSWMGENEKLFYIKIGVFFVILVIVILNGIIGRKTNKMIALYWLRCCKEIFIENFAKVGNDKSFLLEKSYDNYEFYCTGRKNCNYYFVNLYLKRRQCLWRYYIFNYFINENDTMLIVINFERLDKNVLCVYKKSQKKQIERKFPNLYKYTKLIKKKELKEIYEIKGDSSEVTDLVLSGKILNFFNTYDKYINYMCITDIPLHEYEEKSNDHNKRKDENIIKKNEDNNKKNDDNNKNIDDNNKKKEDNVKTEKQKYCYLNLIIPKDVEELKKFINFSIYMIDACASIELPEKVRDNVKKLRYMVEKDDIKRKQELRELQEKKKAKKIQEEKEKVEKMSPEQQRKYEEKKQKKSLRKMKKIKIIKM
ncbi:conserved protein, unknown function [Plasmodium sp. gorilla clade G3]|nr:conserved protein, unknown function [Plasmodium sp. gorilla clade G3]